MGKQNRFRMTAIVPGVALAFGAWAAERTDLSNLVRSNYVHCAFYKGYEKDPVTGDPLMVEGRAAALLHLQGIDVKNEKARAIYTRMSGQREVLAIQTDKAVHFIDNVAGMYLMTTVHSCIDYDHKRGACVTYGATHARIFDSSVLAEPDKVFEKIKKAADPGFCDHSFIDLREASRGDR